MANKMGNAYGLTILCPIRQDTPPALPEGMADQSCTACLQYQLQQVKVNQDSPMARVPNTYLCRFYVLKDVPYQGKPAHLDRLKSDYLVFSSNFYGDLEPYLEGLWKGIEADVRAIMQYCVGFETVRDAASFIEYVKKCQVETTFFFNGSTDEPLADQLKGLYLKQEFSKFAFENQGKGPRELRDAFRSFVERTQPSNVAGPTWRPGAYHLDKVQR